MTVPNMRRSLWLGPTATKWHYRADSLAGLSGSMLSAFIYAEQLIGALISYILCGFDAIAC
jgi:hypothetical protein